MGYCIETLDVLGKIPPFQFPIWVLPLWENLIVLKLIFNLRFLPEISSSWLCPLGLVPYNCSFLHPLTDVGFIPPNEEPLSVDELSLPSCAFSLKDPCLGIILVLTPPFLPGHLPCRGIIYTGAQFILNF